MAQQINAATSIQGVSSGNGRFKFEASANGITGSVVTRQPAPISAEPVTINGKVGVVFKDTRGSVIRYFLREA